MIGIVGNLSLFESFKIEYKTHYYTHSIIFTIIINNYQLLQAKL